MNIDRWFFLRRPVMQALIIALMLAVGPVLAQEQAPEESTEASLAIQTSVYNVIPIQGRLTNADGKPLNGTYTVVFTLYDASSGGTELCTDDDDVIVSKGLFNAEFDWCNSSVLNGQRLYLGVKVGEDEEMTPRMPIYPVPYAFSLRPGAIIEGETSAAILHLENTHESGRGLRAYAMSETGTNYGVVGASRSPDGYGGYFYSNGGGIGLLAKTDVTSNFGVVGLQTGYDVSDFDTGAYWEPAGLFGGRNGVVGYTKEDSGWGVFGIHNTSSDYGAGIKGVTLSSNGWAGSFSSGVGNGVYISTPAGKSGLNVASGTKNAVVGTDDGARLLYSEESAEVWFTDYGFGKLDDGMAIVSIDPIFTQTVNLKDEAYHVFVQVYGNAGVYVADRTPTQFKVCLRDGDPNTEFSYRIVGKRLGFEDHRLERAPWADDDSNLFK